MIIKKVISIMLVLALCLTSIVFVSASTNNESIIQLDYEKAAGELYYLFWCEGEENIDQARIQFQKDFNLSDADIEEIKQLAADNYFANSDLWYSLQNGKAEPNMSDRDSVLLSQSFEKESKELNETYVKAIGLRISDSDKLTQWMSEFITEDIVIQKQKNKEYSKKAVTRAGTRACRVYATQFNANNPNCVALPDKYLKFANLGQTSNIPTKYRSTYSGNDYKINISTELSPQTSAYGIKVLEAGPWSIDDNYWDSAGSLPSSRRLYSDLPLGKPMAQAAYEDGYNGGVNYLGRTITNRAGVDFSRDLAASLGYSSNGSGWVGISTDRLP